MACREDVWREPLGAVEAVEQQPDRGRRTSGDRRPRDPFDGAADGREARIGRVLHQPRRRMSTGQRSASS
jgi:plasmid stabilization system protein ParE